MRVLLFLAVILAGSSSVNASSATLYSSCIAIGSLIEFTGNSEIEVRPSLIPKKVSKSEFYDQSILQQIKFHQKSLQERWEKAGLHVVYSSDPPKIVSREVHTGASKAEYDLDVVQHPDVKIENPYLLNAIEKRHLSSGDEIAIIQYKATWKGVACGSEPITVSKSIAPLDPYMAFWLAPNAKRRLIRWHESEFRLSPVFDSEYADIPDPYYAWYFWKPEGEDADVNILRFGQNAIESEVKATKIAVIPPLKFSPIQKLKIKATVFFGILDAKRKKLNLDDVFQNRKGDQLSWSLAMERMIGGGSEQMADRGSNYAKDFVSKIGLFLDMKKFQYRYDKKKYLLTINGFFKVSQSPLRLQIYFGPTDLLAGEKPQHWGIALSALENDDIVVYNGHSGLGENFSLANLENFGGRKIHPKKHQILAILSCYSYSYNSSYQNPDQLLLTGSDYTSSRGALGLLQWVGQSNQKADMQYVEPLDFLLLRKN